MSQAGTERRSERRQEYGGAYGDALEWLLGPDRVMGGDPRVPAQYTNQNPYSEDIMALLNQIASGPNTWMDQFIGTEDQPGNAAALYGLTMDPTSQFSEGQRALAKRNASLGIEQAMNEMSGLGSLYSGATMDAGNRAAQDAYLAATTQTNQLGAGLLNNLWGQGLGIGGGLYGQAMGGLTGYGDPMFQAPGAAGMVSGGLGTLLKFLPYLE